MSTPIAIEVNCADGTVTERPLTPEEIAAREADAAAAAVAARRQGAESRGGGAVRALTASVSTASTSSGAHRSRSPCGGACHTVQTPVVSA